MPPSTRHADSTRAAGKYRMSSPQTRQVLQAPGKPVVINSSPSTGPLPQNVANAAEPMHHPAEAEQLEGHGEDLGRETMDIPRTEELPRVQPSLLSNTLYSSRIGRRATPKMAGFPPPDLNGTSIPLFCACPFRCAGSRAVPTPRCQSLDVATEAGRYLDSAPVHDPAL